MPKKSKTEWMPYYMPSKEEYECYIWGVENNIKISPYPVSAGPNPREWYLEIFSKGKWVRAPYVYTRDNIWIEFYKMYKYYFDKSKKI